MSNVQGISTVKAIQLAAAQGQKIYTITQENLNVVLQQIELPLEIETDIRNAVNAGMEVTTHERAVDFFGKQSAGYTLIDPVTGAGAYRISDGENGGWLRSAGGGGVIGSAVVALVFTGLPAATAAAFTASMALLMFGAILLLAAVVQLQDGNVVAAEVLCGLGITILIAALSFLPSVMNRIVQLLIAIFGFSIGYAGCSFK